jgi:hypothetical protein
LITIGRLEHSFYSDTRRRLDGRGSRHEGTPRELMKGFDTRDSGEDVDGVNSSPS